MTPILGIIASQGKNTYQLTGSYDSLATVTLSADTASITFAGIPAGYKHLQIRGLLRTSRGLAYDSVNITANGITSYSTHQLAGDGSSASSQGASSAQTSIGYNNIAGNGAGANIFSGIILDVLDYSANTKNKTFRYLTGYDNNGGGYINLASGASLVTDAITSLTFAPQNSSAFKTYSNLALYGVK
jgi:hypothetical protein